ncbi:MAG TPA: glycosyltransferase family 4 protein [Burkholderiales bacterium]|nr:glycosyltransferase family 4 protein [Burkholderiales bacterium]
MRIALIRQRYNPYGGAERIVASALPALERAGVDVTLIARSWDGWGARQVLKVDPFYVGRLWRDWSFARAARAAWRRRGFDLAQSHERIPGCDVYRVGDGVHARWLEIRRAHGSLAERLGIWANPYHRYVCAAEKAMFEHPRLRAVICISRMVRDEVLARFRIAPEKLHVIYNGVDLERFSPRARQALRAEARAALGAQPRDTVFLFVGSGFRRKGVDTAIRALAQAGEKGLKLAVAGRDREAARFEALVRELGVADRVQFLGGREDVRPLYAAADCFMLPTRYDPFGTTALEALAMGLPVIVSGNAGAAELVRPGENGWVCQPGDAAGLARLMREADRALRDEQRLALAARATAERFGIDDMARQLTDLYAALVPGAGR